MRRLTILQIHNRYREGGGEDTVVWRERALLEAAGHEVVGFQTENPPGMVAAAGTLLVSPWNPVSAGHVGDMIANQRPDVAHVHNTWWRLTPSILKPLAHAGVPVVMTLHNYRLLCANAMLYRGGRPCEDCVGSHPWHAALHACYRGSILGSIAAATAIALPRMLDVWQDADLLLPLTEFSRERFIAGGFPRDKLIVKSNFVDDPGPRANDPSGSGVVLYVGRLSEEKGIQVLLDAWHDARPDGLKLVVVGDGPLRRHLEASAPVGVRFVGRMEPDQVRQLMLAARGLVLPSVCYEGQPVVLLEALASGLPVVISEIGGIPETVGDLRAAVLAPPGDRSAWAAALSWLTDASWVDAAGAHARAVYEARYTPDRALDALLAIYQRAMVDSA